MEISIYSICKYKPQVLTTFKWILEDFHFAMVIVYLNKTVT